MTTKPKPDTAKNEVEAVIAEATQITAPVIERLSTHRERVAQAVRELEGDRFTLVSQRDTLTRAYEAAMSGIGQHIQDVDLCLALYENGMNSLPADGSKAIE